MGGKKSMMQILILFGGVMVGGEVVFFKEHTQKVVQQSVTSKIQTVCSRVANWHTLKDHLNKKHFFFF